MDLKLRYDGPLSNFALNFNLRSYIMELFHGPTLSFKDVAMVGPDRCCSPRHTRRTPLTSRNEGSKGGSMTWRALFACLYATGFLCLLTDYLLERRGERRHLLVATTGDTGPAAAHATAGLKNIDTWVLYPKGGFVSEEQERQMTSLEAPNVQVVGVDGCRDGGDDLDEVVARLFADAAFRDGVGLGSVNSINWGHVLTTINTHRASRHSHHGELT
jgi:threonine synthase